MLLLQQCLADIEGLEVEVHTGGWVDDEATLDDASAVVLFSDGRAGHPFADDSRQRRLEPLLANGLGLGCLHYAVEFSPQPNSRRFSSWVGGTYEFGYSYNPFWEARFDSLPEHDITRGVEPFTLRDEWYFNIRFANQNERGGASRFAPLLVARPSREVRMSPGGDSRTPYEHIVADAGRSETLMWAVDRPDGGRGFGTTGGHFHDNWADDNFRKLVLNAMLWLAKIDVPDSGVASSVSREDLDRNLDDKEGIPACTGCGCLVR